MARRLAAVLAADMVGFSAQMARDEAGTLSRLIAFRKTVFDPHVRAHHGRIVKLMGDGALVEFPSVVEAVACAIAVQSDAAVHAGSGIELRIGVSLGDVIAEGSDIYGDGVNIAARLEALAEPGGLCISGIVWQSLGNRLDAAFEDLGAHELKNIDAPVQVFRWRPEGAAADAPPFPAPAPAPNKPSIVVLAFDNMSADPDQEYFSDGIAEDIITALSHFREFFVIARNTSFTYKGQAIRVDAVCRELGVRYLLEGSVRKAGSRVRVTAQLIDGETGVHLWAARYDRDLDDIFAVQDEITAAIVGAVAPETLGAETKRARAKTPDNLTAWDRVLQARWHLGKFTEADNRAAQALLRDAVRVDPEMSDAHAVLALCDLLAMLHLWSSDTAEAIASARRLAQDAVALDDQNADAHAILGLIACFARDFADAERHLQRATALNPNLAIGYGFLGAYHGVSGDYCKARDAALRAVALSPRDPLKAFWLAGLGIGAFVAEAYEDCVANARAALKDHPGYASLMRQEAAALGMLGRQDEARAAIDRLLERMPGLTIARVRQIVPVRDPGDHARWLEGLRRAGLPE